MIRLGLCCKFIKEPIHFRTTTATYLSRLKNIYPFLNELCTHNVHALEDSIEYCIAHKIGCFRISSRFLPVATHPDFLYSIDDLPSSGEILTTLQRCKKRAKEANIRLSFHPDQFVLLSSKDEAIIEKSLRDLEYHTYLATYVGADVINIHGGGAYDNKTTALTRFVKNFSRLSKKAQQLLTIENDDRVYTPTDLLPLCKELKIPLVYDAHHHRCLPDQLSIEEGTQKALSTWNREPLFHISSPLHNKKFRSHNDYVDSKDVPECWKKVPNLTVEVEAKAKEKAVLRLYKELKKRNWPIH